jgi:hypothetical protein
MKHQFRTNLNCQNCVAAVRPHLDAAGLRSWDVNTADPNKILSVDGDPAAARRAVQAAGFAVLEELTPALAPPAEPRSSYRPVLLLVGLLALGTALLEFADGHWHWHRAMPRFMGGFFVAFAYFKLLDIGAFAAAFSTYDLIAARLPGYGKLYPFLELALGGLYLANVMPTATNAAALVLMLVGTAGVVRTLASGRKVKCACLGAVFNLPMSYVTLAEDALMAAMAAAMLAI